MIKEAIVTKVVQKKDAKTGGMHYFTTQHGTFWTWQVAFDNKDWGEFNTKDSNAPKFVVGETASYTIEPNKHNSNNPPTVKHVNPDYAGAGTGASTEASFNKQYKEDPETQRLIIRQTCIKAAAEFCNQRTDGWEPVADHMFSWVMKPEEVEAKAISDFLTNETDEGPPETDEEPPF